MTLKQLKIQAIEKALTSTGGNKDKAARELGVSKRSLRNWVKQYPTLSRFRNEPTRAGSKNKAAA